MAEGQIFRILSVGNDPGLLASRAAVLRYAGAEVESADVPTALSSAMLRRYDLLVLCHSVSTHAADELSEIFRVHWPESKILLLGADIREDVTPIKFESKLSFQEGPAALINKVSGWMRQAR